jgi:hypothetical protein
LRRPKRSIQSNIQEALIQNVSSLLMGNAPGTYPGKEKTKETDRRNRNWFAPFYLLPLVFEILFLIAGESILIKYGTAAGL